MKDKEKLFRNIIKFILGALFVFFLIIYLGESSTYYESKLHEKRLFTEEKIKKFEEDVAAGKNVKLENYLDNQTMNYHNKTSDAGLFLSKLIGNSIKKSIEKTFKMISKFIE